MLTKRQSYSSPKTNRGFSITELLIGSAAGLIVVGGAVALVVAIIGSNSDTIKSSRLNQDLNAIMAIMVNEIRRAGFNGDLAPYTGADSSIQVPLSEDCVYYAYAVDDNCVDSDCRDDVDGIFDQSAEYGFRFDSNNGEIEMRKTAADYGGCGDTYNPSDWEAVNDNNEVQITSFVVVDNSQCLDNDGSVIACGHATAEIRIRQLGLTLAGQLTNDTAVNSTVQETVRIRNIDPL